MGATCGCINNDAEAEISAVPGDISLSRTFPNPFDDFQNGQITVPVVNLEKEFIVKLESLKSNNDVVNVWL